MGVQQWREEMTGSCNLSLELPTLLLCKREGSKLRRAADPARVPVPVGGSSKGQWNYTLACPSTYMDNNAIDIKRQF